MPIYEYQCQKCGGTFEYTQKMSDEPKTVCETCGGELQRLISRTAFSLKGGGWYKDLYASPKPGGDSKPAESKSESKPAESKPAESKSAESKSESKPADSKPAKKGDS